MEVDHVHQTHLRFKGCVAEYMYLLTSWHGLILRDISWELGISGTLMGDRGSWIPRPGLAPLTIAFSYIQHGHSNVSILDDMKSGGKTLEARPHICGLLTF